ncbi:MAG: hypothetical protein JRM99_05245 [Nitrososphaerota archaeon]|nr:hypothetical protein [Nitrososphaerota archaeon]
MVLVEPDSPERSCPEIIDTRSPQGEEDEEWEWVRPDVAVVEATEKEKD